MIHLKSIVVEGVDRCLVSLDVPDCDLKQKLNSRGFRDSLRRKSMYFPQISPAYLHLKSCAIPETCQNFSHSKHTCDCFTILQCSR